MSLLLKKKHVSDEGDEAWIVTCFNNGSDTTLIPQQYTFDYTKIESEMEAIIVPDLTDKGYEDLSPVTWEEI